MNIKINNFGPIKKADLDIAPLTIFIGQNNSGKSYSSRLIHSLINPFDQSAGKPNKYANSIPLSYLIRNNKMLYNEFSEKLIKYIDSNPDFSQEPFEFPKDKFDLLLSEGIGRFYTQSIEYILRFHFHNINNLNNLMSNDSFNIEFNGIHLTNNDGSLSLKNFTFDSINSFNEIGYVKRIIEKISRTDDKVLLYLNIDSSLLTHVETELIPTIVHATLTEVIIENLTDCSYYLPELTDMYLFDEDYVLSNKNKKFRPLKMNDELMTLILDKSEEDYLTFGYFKDLGMELSEELFGCDIKPKPHSSHIEFIDSENNILLSYDSLSASMREQLALIIYLVEESQVNDTIIIEEPESHLHPKNQRILVKYLVKLVNNGLNIILNTQSDYIIEQFNNFIRLGEVDSETLEELNYTPEHVLNPSDIRIYNFKKDSDYQYIAEPVDINETGFDEESFSEISDALYDESADIIDAMRSD